jgi:L-cysteine:1D-myo-inositol 2-amino-2-deoxy-alpha-D-glucopyranoside ligase
MVRLGGEKMSKSRGNLVFVSQLLSDGADPMAVRLAVLAHHYRDDWDWSAGVLAAGDARLRRWRAAVSRWQGQPREQAGAAVGGPAAGAGAVGHGDRAAVTPAVSGEAVLAAVRESLAGDLDAPGALAAVDRWADAVLDGNENPPGAAATADLVRDTADALLGVAL